MVAIPTKTVAALVRRLAWRLAPPGPKRCQEMPDCEQALWTSLLAAWPKFDPERGGEFAFARAVLLRASKSIVRARHVRKYRTHGRVPTRDTGVFDTDEFWYSSDDEGRLRFEIRFDLEPTLARLPADLRTLADLLETNSFAEAARILGVPRSSLQRTLARLRRHFEAAGVTP